MAKGIGRVGMTSGYTARPGGGKGVPTKDKPPGGGLSRGGFKRMSGRGRGR
jgi:hypothetical protein